MKTPTVVLLASAIFGMCRGFPSGVPSSACGSMLPRHGYRTRPQDHSQNPSPYAITIEGNVDTYTPGQRFELTLHSSGPSVLIKGFIMEARTISGQPIEPVGTFLEPHKGTKTICDDKALGHYRTWRVRGDKFRASWIAPDRNIGEIVFVATVVQSYSVYWSNVRSVVIKAYRPPATTRLPKVMAADDSKMAALLINSTTEICDDALLTSLPDERPYVAILCDAHAQCPCGWVCCQSCADNKCVGHAICRQPLTTSPTEDQSPGQSEEPVMPTRERKSVEYSHGHRNQR